MTDSLKTMIARIEERQLNIADNIGSIKDALREHMENDKREFNAIRHEISQMNKYAASIAIVAGGIGAIGSWAWGKITGA
jgi:flagellar capping protein FliD